MPAIPWGRPYAVDDDRSSNTGRDWEAEARGWRKKVEQVERLVKLGSFEVEFDTGALKWSAGTYAIFGLDPSFPVTVEQALAFYSAETQMEIGRHLDAARHSGQPYDLTVPFKTRSGQAGWARMIAQVETTAGSARLVGVLRDITHERETEEQLRLQAHQDMLTGLPNRRVFQTHLDQALETRGQGTAVCLVDIDHFKAVNDAYGHAVGDGLLQEVARRLVSAVRSTDLVARLGGDEFAILLRGLKDRRELQKVVETTVSAVRLPLRIDGVTLTSSVSIGACLGGSTLTADVFLKKADTALYKAKAAGRDQACLYRPSLRKEVDEHERLLDQVRNGLARSQFEAHYQPIIDLRTHIVRGWEALIRWRHPSKGLLLPARFLPALQDPKTSVAIDDFMLGESLRQMRQWLDADVPVTCAGVNVSEAQLRRADLLPSIKTLLDRHQLTPDRLKLEVIETAFVGASPREVAATIDELARFGVVSALDDFGTGYASLTHLKQFKVERIKLDRTFVANLGTSAYDQAIVRCMISLGRDLGLRVTAEGIETVEQLDLLRVMGCDCGQGYLFSRPMHADEVPSFLTRWQQGEAGRLLGDKGDRRACASYEGLDANGVEVNGVARLQSTYSQIPGSGFSGAQAFAASARNAPATLRLDPG